MLRILGPASRYCDRVSRRSFLQIGGLTAGGLTLADLLRQPASAASQGTAGLPHKSVIFVYLSGGLSHQDTFDLKPEAPAEVRGEFRPIDTNVPGIQFGELLPRLAQVANRLAIVRSLVGQRDEHSSFQSLTGSPMDVSQREGRPNFGSVVSRIQGPTDPLVPPFVDLFPTMQHRPYNSPTAGSLGRAYDGVKADGEDLASMKLRFVEADRFQDRRRLWRQFDQLRERLDAGSMTAADAGYQRAFDVLTSSRLVHALDLSREDPRTVERYGHGSPAHVGDGAPLWNDQLLVARRLVEAGVRCVTVAYGFWDTHGGNFAHLRQHLPTLDQGLSALVEDLYARGLDRDVTLCVWGEFGRTPKINANAGRDHWPAVNFAVFSGGGLPTGQVIGATDKLAAYAAERAIDYRDVLATLYHQLGMDHEAFVRDVSDRPVRILPESCRPIRELVG